MKRFLSQFTRWFDLVLESECRLCQRSVGSSMGQSLCQDCQRQIESCRLSHPAQYWQDPLPVFAWGVYGGALKRSIAALKYHNQPQLARPLGHWLARAWLASPVSMSRTVIVIPIPMHPDKQRQRGFNQAELLAEAFCEVTGLPLQRQGLRRVRATDAQFSLSPQAREHNLAGAFELDNRWLNQNRERRFQKAILLLDDIYTTGATARAAIQVFQQQHLPVYGLAAIAKAVDQRSRYCSPGTIE